ncbi:carboxypeptidase-like regulatory domain-containing protein [Pedobacter psychroterrae]|uniref:Carboxypeptidase-like protein n=1 Tax=Pedobacter psychroterrae TaxID=2530453 RepID=A0A4R0NUZ3_9SPHI|nr:carboxypeptidase-like regulatory domain-containing protein [Pedobacter psychroterrae]TCD03345.1 hypothetical protein EZ437_05080 [Pedobacter psychroterrae]
MNKDWLDIDVLEDYLDGKLDAKSMNRVERAALEDPFVAEALAGLSMSPKRSLASLSLLQKQLQQRVTEQQYVKKKTVITWQRLSIAATAAVLFISIGIIFWMKQVNYQQTGDNQSKKVDVVIAPKVKATEPVKPVPELIPPMASDEVAMNTKAKTRTMKARVNEPSALSEQKAVLMEVAVSASPYSSSLVIGNSIRGKVTDETTGEPIVGANIYKMNADGTYRGIGATDQAGEFNIKVDSLTKEQEIIVSYVSYTTKRITVKPNELLAVALHEDKSTMDEVVIRGYQKRTREVTTGSSFIVSGKKVADVPVSNVEQLLQGKVAGLNIQNNVNAEPTIGWEKYREYLIKENRFNKETKPEQTAEYLFVIKKGRPVNISVAKGISKKYDKEAIRLIKKGSDWKLSDPTLSEVSVVLKF